MKSLIHKDILWLSIFLAIGILIPSCIIYSSSSLHLWVYNLSIGISYLQPLFISYAVLGLCFGVFAGLREELTRTEEYLRHRTVTALKMYTAKTSACLMVVACWVLLPLFGSMLYFMMFGQRTELANYSRFYFFFCAGIPGFSMYAAGYYAASLRLFWLGRVVIGGVIVIAITHLSYAATLAFLPNYEPFELVNLSNPSLPYLAVHLCFFVPLILFAYKNFNSHLDLDHPWEKSALPKAGILPLVGFIVSFGLIFSGMQHSMMGRLKDSYPILIENKSGQIERGVLEDTGGMIAVDEKHEPLKDAKTVSFNRNASQWWLRTLTFEYFDKRSTSFWSWELGKEVTSFLQGWRLLGRFEQDKGVYNREYYYFNPNQRLVFRTSHYGVKNSSSQAKIGKGPDNRSFSAEVKLIHPKSSSSRTVNTLSQELEDSILLYDPQDSKLWIYEVFKKEKSFKPLNLPNNDVYADCSWINQKEDSIVVEGKTYVADLPPKKVIIHGEKNSYLYDKGNFKAADDALLASISKDKAIKKRYHFELQERDPISPLVAAKDSNGQVVLTHQYGPYTLGQKSAVGVLYLMSICKSPVLQTISFFKDDNTSNYQFEGNIFDPVFYGGNRIWLLLVNFALCGFLGYVAAKNLQKMGVNRSRALTWAGFILLGGIGACVFCSLVETKRAYRKKSLVKAPELLIGS